MPELLPEDATSCMLLKIASGLVAGHVGYGHKTFRQARIVLPLNVLLRAYATAFTKVSSSLLLLHILKLPVVGGGCIFTGVAYKAGVYALHL